MEKTKHKKKLGGYPAVGVVISITLALLVTGVFGILVMYSQELEDQIRQNIRMQVYLKSNLTETQRLQIENKLLSQPYVDKEHSRGVEYVSKDEAAKKFIAETGEDFIKFIGENPLRDAYLVSIDRNYHSLVEMEKIKSDIKKMNGVFQVFYVEALIDSVNSNVTKIGLILIGLIAVLLVTVVLLINNTLRIALFSQRFLIRSMQLVGAKKWFILRPFLVRAAGYGLLAGLIAALLLWSLSNYAQSKIADLSILHSQNSFLTLLGFLLVLGMIVAVCSTFFSIRRYLRMSLDQLY
ncbi:cell division protein FtsX [Chryseolinea soli]|uniref:Cell division protein FtsX n=1 Tax=Chryseolinea soli TaxID=2321403 RepID=A0A385SVQ2_9BACT|nr:permease-like cell division protein FtsX [Chryseolinea soli]AYB34045.1 FtsX-like permease family protein [Chryseolinea soli]